MTDLTTTPNVVTVLVNWNGAADTVECLESLFTSDYPNQRVVVVDNGSKDGSLSKLMAWANGATRVHRNAGLRGACVTHDCKKPLRVLTLGLNDVLRGRGFSAGIELALIDAERNHGFAGGVNIGVRLALCDSTVRYVWVLNNDTVVARDCLSHMARRMSNDRALGMCGSRILYYSQPDRVQVLGGARFRPWVGASHLIGSGQNAAGEVDVRLIERSIDHLSGASMLVSRDFMEDIGLMDEGYFLYYEEADWAMRGKGRYRFAYADDAVVYHKEGASIGSSDQRARRSALASFFLVRSRLRFTRRFYPWALPSVFAYTALVALRDLVAGHDGQARAMFSALRGLSAQQALGWTPD